MQKRNANSAIAEGHMHGKPCSLTRKLLARVPIERNRTNPSTLHIDKKVENYEKLNRHVSHG